MREAIISLILKKEKYPFRSNSYRPMSLLNTDVKIIAKILSWLRGSVTNNYYQKKELSLSRIDAHSSTFDAPLA